MSSEVLPPELVLAIQRALELEEKLDTDPIDVLSTAFNAADVLNNLFPNEESLGQIVAVQMQLAENERKLQREIDQLHAELVRDQDPNRMQLIQEMISDLLGQMSRIREKATESEAVVRNITKDIQVLDRAKQNLITSMTTLKRLQMLVNGMTQLEDLAKEKQYKDTAQTLSAVKQLASSFKPYTPVQQVSQVWKRVNSLQGEIRAQIDSDFDGFFMQDPSRPIKPNVIADACLVVDVLGQDVRSQIIDRYVALELKEYRRIFRTTDEAGQLDNISRRFAWFRRMLNQFENEQGRVFPGEWKVGWSLLAKFSEITREDLSTLLSKARSTMTVKTYLDYLQLVSEFEASFLKKYGASIQEILDTVASNSSVARSIKTISSAFEPHMGIFVDAQDKAISDLIAPHRRSAIKSVMPRVSLEAPQSGPEAEGEQESLVLPSSTELFYFYGQSLDQCSKLVTGKGQGLFDLCGVCKKWLKVYAEDVLIAGLKRLTTGAVRRSTDTRYDVEEIKRACLTLNTADYCQTTTIELEENLRSKISDEFKEKVTLQEQRDIFVGVISAAINQLLQYLDASVDPVFAILSKMNWSNQLQVSGQSSYITELVKAAESFTDVAKSKIEGKKYWRNFCDKVCSAMVAKFTVSLVKSRPLGEIGAEQLLIDLQCLRAYLIRLPGEATSMYTKALTKSTTRLETLLKVIVTPADPYEGFILNYTLLIGDASFSNFQKILDLKGTPKSEQTALLDSFLTLTSTKTELESTSFLSSLDMDPTPATTQTMLSPSSSRVNLLTEGVFAGLASPPSSRPGSANPLDGEQKREVFSDLRRLVSFGLRRDTIGP